MYPFNSNTVHSRPRSRIPIALTVTSTISDHPIAPSQPSPRACKLISTCNPSKTPSALPAPYRLASMRVVAVTFLTLLAVLFLSSPSSPSSITSSSSSSSLSRTASAGPRAAELPHVSRQASDAHRAAIVATPRHNYSGSPTFRGDALDLHRIKPCKNAIIFTGARQGSTWFVDSIEKCAYSINAADGAHRKFHSNVFKKTEIWKHFGEPKIDGTDLSVIDALRYVVSNNSIKVFPSVFWRRRVDIANMLIMRHRYDLTVLILRRDVDATWHSWLNARSSKQWRNDQAAQHDQSPYLGDDADVAEVAAPAPQVNKEADLDDDLFSPHFKQLSADSALHQQHQRQAYHYAQQKNGNWTEDEYRRTYQRFVDSRRRYDKGVEQLLREYHVPYDVFDYEVAQKMPAILARNNRCLIRNCNFPAEEQRQAVRKLSRWEASEYSTYGQDMLGEEMEAIREGGAASELLHGRQGTKF